MIAKLETGNGFRGALRYDVRAGKGTAKELARVLDAYGVSYDFDDKGNLLINPKQVGFDFRQQTMGYTGEGVIRKPVYHWVLSYSPKDNVSEEQMQKDAKEFLKRIGFDDTQYVMTVHYDKEHDHLHIVTNIVNNQGKRIPTMGLIDKAHAAAAAITKENGYTWGEKRKKENISEDKIHKPHDRAREVIEPMIREALAMSVSFEGLQDILLNNYNIMCNYTKAKDGNRGRLSFCFEFEGQQHSFNGSSVARDLSFGYVNNELRKNNKEFWAEYNALRPTLSHIYNLCSVAFEERKRLYGQKENLGGDDEISRRYIMIQKMWEVYNESREADYQDLQRRYFRTIDGGPLGLPMFLLAVAVKFILDIVQENNRHDWYGYRDEIERLNAEIDNLKLRRSIVYDKLEGNERKMFDTTQMRDHIKENMVALKEIINIRPFDFVAAAKALNQSSPQHKLEPPKINFCELMMTVDTRTEFERNLLIKHNAIIAPINDINGHAVDFEITLANEGGKVKASEILGSDELRVMTRRWTTLGQQEQGNQQQKVTTAPQYIEQERFNVYDKDYAAQFKKHFEEALEYNFTSPYQFAAIMNLRGIQVTAIGKDDTDVEMCFRGHIRGEEVTYWYGQEEVGIDAMNRLQAKLEQNKEEHKVQGREQARVATIVKKLFEWSTSQRHFEKMLKKKGIDVVFYRDEDNPGHIAGVTFVEHTVKTAFKASELDNSIAASVFDKAVESGHWKAEDTTKAMDEDNIITEWQEDELAKNIKTALNLLGKGGGPLFQNTHGNHTGKTKNQIAWEKQQAEEEQQAHIYRHRR